MTNYEISKKVSDLRKSKTGIGIGIRDIDKLIEATGELYAEAFEVALTALKAAPEISIAEALDYSINEFKQK